MTHPLIYSILDDKAKRMLSLKLKNYEITNEDIISCVCSALDLDVELVKSDCRKRPLVNARMICIFFISKINPKTSLKKIGTMFSNRDHSTMIYALQTFNDIMPTNDELKASYNKAIAYMNKYTTTGTIDMLVC